MAEDTTLEVVGFRGIAEEAFEALADCFKGRRLMAAALGLATSLVITGALGIGVTTLMLRGSLAGASVLAILGAAALYIGLLLTYAALCRMAFVERHGNTVTAGSAFSFAIRRCHIVVGAPMFTAVVGLAVVSLGSWVGGAISANETIGAVLAPIALVLMFLLNLALVCAILLTHALTAPCVACLNASLTTAASRLRLIVRERFPSFLAYQAAVLVAGVPLLVLTAGMLAAAFWPAFSAVSAGRAVAQASEAVPRGPASIAEPGAWGGTEFGRPSTEEEADETGWLGGGALSQGPLIGVAAVVALMLLAPPMIFAASAQSAVYIGLTGGRFAEAPLAAAAAAGEPLPEKRPPIVHCWRCDAINRYSAEQCSKCGAALAVCPYCFTTNQVVAEKCSSCDRELGESVAEEEETETVEA